MNNLLSSYIKSAWRNILRHKLFSIINIMGLAIGLTAVMLITLYVRYEISYDSFWKNADNIFRLQTSYYIPEVEEQHHASVSPLVKDVFLQDFSEVEYAARFLSQYPTIGYNNEYFQDYVSLADPEFLNIFHLPLYSGTLSGALENPNNLIISKSMANRIFGEKNPLNEIISIKFVAHERDYKVVAVMEDMPDNSMIEANIIVPFNDQEWLDTHVMRYGWSSFGGPLYYSLKDPSYNEEIIAQIPSFTDRHYDSFKNREGYETSDIVKLRSLNIQDIHLKSGANYERRNLGDQTTIFVFALVSVFILLIASINFVNLSTARATERAKEVSLRKTVGATKKHLVIQFLGESVFLTLIALLISFCLVEITIPVFTKLIGLEITFSIFSVDSIALLAMTLIVGVIGGLYPAFILARFRPAKILKANQSSTSNVSHAIRSLLVVFQFTISICLFVAASVVYMQMNFVQTENLGFDQKNLLVIKAFSNQDVNHKAEVIRHKLDQLPNVTDLTTSNFMPAPVSSERRSIWTEKGEGASDRIINSSYVGYNYFTTYGVNFIVGRDYEEGRDYNMPSYQNVAEGVRNNATIIVNESAVRHLNLGSPEEAVGKYLYQPWMWDDVRIHRQFEIIGVIPDIKLENMKKNVRPEIFFLDTKRTDVFTIRYAGNPSAVIREIDQIWKQEVPEVGFEYEFAESRMLSEYIKEINELHMFTTFAGLAIFIACLGLFGLASFTAERRTKEIGIRKVFGAESGQIVRMLVFQFSKPVLIANLIAWPIAYIFMSKWLETFVYRIDNIMIIFLCMGAGLTALLIAWATVAGNSYAVARQNPIKALRYE